MIEVREGVVIVQDFLSQDLFTSLQRGDYTVINTYDEPEYCRVKMDIHSAWLNEDLMDFMDNPSLLYQTKHIVDLAWRLVWNELLSSETYSGVSVYEPKGVMRWHCDHVVGIAFNWIVTLKGSGVIKWCHAPFPTQLKGEFNPPGQVAVVDLKPNQFILMPAYYPHQVLIGKEGRESVHGHFKARREA